MMHLQQITMRVMDRHQIADHDDCLFLAAQDLPHQRAYPFETLDIEQRWNWRELAVLAALVIAGSGIMLLAFVGGFTLIRGFVR